MENAKAVLKRYRKAHAKKQPWVTIYKEALDYSAPYHQTFDEGASRDGANISNPDLVFDSTAQNALDGFVSNLQSSLVPPVKDWIILKTGAGFPKDGIPDGNGGKITRQDADKRLQEITKTIFDYLKVSNFDTEISASFSDLALGVGCLSVAKGTQDNPFSFSALSISELYLEEGPKKRVDTMYRESKYVARNLAKEWPEDFEPSAALAKIIEEKPESELCMVEAVIPTRIKWFNPKTNKDVEMDGYRYMVIDKAREHIVVDRHQRSNPWIAFRWLTRPREVYSRGPMIKALPDIKTVNKVQELILKKGSLDTVGAYTVVDEGGVNIDNIRVVPGALIPVESNGGTRGPSIMPLQGAGQLNTSQIILENKVININKTMFAEPLGPIDAPVRTATEIAFRQQELAKRIGSAFGKLQYELMAPLINRLLHILEELDLLPYDLDGFRVDGRIIGINYVSPLAQAQNMEEFNAMVMYAETMVRIGGPQLGMAMVKLDEFAKETARLLNTNLKIVPSDEEFAQMKQALIQNIAMQQTAQMNAIAGQEQQLQQGQGAKIAA
jgi:hypothetical protein